VIGTILHDRWRVLSALGKGGMGEVWLAEHMSLGRKEALKILMPTLATDPQFVSRFRREARAVNRLRHPNIIAVYDFGQLPDGRFFLSMEYAEGESVYKLVKRDDHFAVPRALHVLGQLAYAVHHAHSRGVVHRDLKPDNLILVGDDETLKVLDFGVAKIVAADHAESVALSSNNMVWGSPRYMAPERIRGVGNDARSDIYSMGIIAFELVIGGPPFAGNSNDVIKAHLSVLPDPPSEWRPSLGIPRELDDIIMKCIAKDPGDRFQSAAELYAALHKVPGYPQQRTEQRRRFVPQPRRPATLAPPDDGAAGHADAPSMGATTATSATSVGTEDDDGLTIPTAVPVEAPHGPSDSRPSAGLAAPFANVRGALRSVAEALLDLGLTDTRLLAGVAMLRDHEQAIAGLEAAQDALEHESAAVRETLADRETSLRFALAELEYKAQQPDRPPDIDVHIGELRDRLAGALAGGARLGGLQEDLASVAAARAAGLDKLIAAYDELERVVEEMLPAYVDHPSVRPHADRLALVKRRRG
jgi:serine/threonine protein kinase